MDNPVVASREVIHTALERARSKPNEQQNAPYEEEIPNALLSAGSAALHEWWSKQPASQVVEVAYPMLKSTARKHPLALISIAFLGGAALSAVKPWKALPVAALANSALGGGQAMRLVQALFDQPDSRRST